MAVPTSSDLGTLRDEVVAALVAGGVTAVDYTSNLLTPPVAAVVPAQPYVAWGEGGAAPFAKPARVRHDVLLLSHVTGSREQEADLMDRLICQAVAALSDHGVKRVSRPGNLTVDGTKYMGAVLSLEQDVPDPTTPEG